jgi:NADPH:quinone reductase-like Zn-dependent oxidoreductase
VLVDATGRTDLGAAAQCLNPRGRIVAIAGRDRRIDLDQWSFYTRELQLLGFVMSAMTVGELAAAAAWINVSAPEVSVGRVLPFADAALAHTIMEQGELPRLPDRTIGRLVLTP